MLHELVCGVVWTDGNWNPDHLYDVERKIVDTNIPNLVYRV